MARLADFYKVPEYAPSKRLEDIGDQEVTVLAVRFRQGGWGEYAFVDVKLPDESVVSIITGASLVLEALHNAISANALPLPAVFTKQGRMWFIK